MTLEHDVGLVRIIAHSSSHDTLGIQAVGHGVSELPAAFSVAIEMSARLEDIGAIVHAYPTMSEAFPKAALKELGRAILV